VAALYSAEIVLSSISSILDPDADMDQHQNLIPSELSHNA